MTIISHSHRFAFVHIYKCGGTSFENLLRPYSRTIDQLRLNPLTSKLYSACSLIEDYFSFNTNGGTKGGQLFSGLHKHARLSEIDLYLGSKASSYKVISLIRNPSDWVVSLYCYIRSSKNHHLNSLVSKMSISFFLENFFDLGFAAQSDFLASSSVRNPCQISLYRLESIDSKLTHIYNFLNIPPYQTRQSEMPRLNITSSGSLDKNTLNSQVSSNPLFIKYFSADLHLWNSLK